MIAPLAFGCSVSLAAPVRTLTHEVDSSVGLKTRVMDVGGSKSEERTIRLTELLFQRFDLFQGFCIRRKGETIDGVVCTQRFGGVTTDCKQGFVQTEGEHGD